ncbi:hypothetical protein ACRJ4W_36180 [Streptomyces sp. GLT-R25]
MTKGWNRRAFLRTSVAGAGASAALGSGAVETATASAGTAAGASGAGRLRIERTTVEYAETLLGTEVEKPRLTWELAAEGRGARQTAYQVRVALSEKGLRQGRRTVWDSGRVTSDRTVGIVYDGPALHPRNPLPLARQGLGRRGPAVGVECAALVGDNVVEGCLGGVLDRRGRGTGAAEVHRCVLDLVTRFDLQQCARRAPLVPRLADTGRGRGDPEGDAARHGRRRLHPVSRR